MIYDAAEKAYEVATTNFTADFIALIAAKGLGGLGLTTAATLIKRQDAETFIGLNAALPAIGVIGRRAHTQAKDQSKRDNVSEIVYDYFAVGPEPSTIAKQAELAAEALLRSIDRLWASGSGVFGAGELPGSISIDFDPGYVEVQQPNYGARARVSFPVTDRDEGL